MKKTFLTLLAIFSVLPGFCQQLTVNVTSGGAKPGPGTLNTVAIQKSIDKLSAAGGGKLVVPKGEFRTGTLVLKSGVNLHLEAGAVLAGSDQRKDYDDELPALVIAKDQHDISITGKGTIDGRGKELIKDILERMDDTAKAGKKSPPESARTSLVYFENCDRIRVTGVVFKDATSWVTHYSRCTNLVIDSVRVESVAYWNNDGIDINNCKQVSITNCYINSSDDAIVLKSESRVPDSCVNIYVANCRLRSSANAFKLGTGSHGGFRNITARNLEVFDTYRSAVALEAVDGGFLENVEVDNVRATNTGSALLIRLGHRNKDSRYSAVKNVRIANLYVEVPATKPDKGYPVEGPLLRYPPGTQPAKPGEFESVSPWNDRHNDPASFRYKHNVFPSSITGLPGHPVQNVSLENITIVYEGGADKNVAYFPVDSLERITEAESAYPEFSMFGELPCWGLYLRHAEGIFLKNVNMSYRKKEFRTALIADDIKGLFLEKINIPSYTDLPVIIMNKVTGYSGKDLHLPGEETKAIQTR